MIELMQHVMNEIRTSSAIPHGGVPRSDSRSRCNSSIASLISAFVAFSILLPCSFTACLRAKKLSGVER